MAYVSWWDCFYICVLCLFGFLSVLVFFYFSFFYYEPLGRAVLYSFWLSNFSYGFRKRSVGSDFLRRLLSLKFFDF